MQQTDINFPLQKSLLMVKCASKHHNPNISMSPLRQCLPFSWTTLRGKPCQHLIAVMGVVDIFGHGTFDYDDFSTLQSTISVHSVPVAQLAVL
jgi:hypothetical protein